MERPQTPLLLQACWLIAWLILLHNTAAAAMDGDAAAAAPTTRFFIDEGYFLEGDTEILRAYIAASQGRMTISGESTAAFLSVKGYYQPDSWDVYWTIRQACHMAFKHMTPQQLVNCIPGISAMSLKRTFVSTWQQAYGELAFNYIPRSYLIPQQYWLWRSYLLATASPPDRKWVLKANIHRGKGVSVVPQREALSHALTHKHQAQHSNDGGGASSSSSNDNGVHYLNVLVQSYLQQQLVIAGRSSYIRVWLLVTSINPLRAYLFDGGFAIFGKQKGAAAASPAGTAGSSNNKTSTSSSSSTDDLIVNLWIQDRNSSPIWSLQHLQEYLDKHPDVVQPLPDPPPPPQQQQVPQTPGRRLQQQQQQQQGKPSNSSGSSSSTTDTSKQLRGRRRTFADAWQDMQTSASLVLAAALPAMRATAAEVGAPAQGTFEYFGLDFVLDAHLQPWMLEVNAIPSMSRRKKSDCAGETATAACKLTTTGGAAAGPAAGSAASAGSSSKDTSAAGAAAAAAADDFDAQKEQFVHDMLSLLGLPVGTAGAGAGATSAQQNSPADGAGVLRMAAAAAAAAGIRSASAAATDKSSNSSSSSIAGGGGGGGGSARSSSDRHLLSAAAASATSQPDRLQGLMRRRRRLRQLQRQHTRHSRRKAAASGNSGSGSAGGDGDGPSKNSSSSSSSQAVDTATAAPPSATGFMGVNGLQWSGPAPDVKQLPAQLQKLLCPPTSAVKQGSGGGGGGGSSSSAAAAAEFACITCLTADDLAALAAAEGELQRVGRFVAVHDVITAHRTSKQALKAAAAAAASSGSSSSGSASGDVAAGPTAPPSSSSSSTGSLYLSQSPSVWQKLFRAWKGMSQGSVGVRDLAVMKYYTTASTLSAEKGLGLQRLDYVMSAWLRVRRDASCSSSTTTNTGGSQAADCVVKRLGLLISKCYLP